mgnify:CR=1 FL=1
MAREQTTIRLPTELKEQLQREAAWNAATVEIVLKEEAASDN